MNRLTKKICNHYHGAEGRNINNLTGNYCRGKYEATAVTERLGHYEDLEEKLENVYGECDGLLERVVDMLVKHPDVDIDNNVCKAVLLTDEQVDEWLAYKKLK